MYGEVRTTDRITPDLVRVVLGGPGLDGFEMPQATDVYLNIAVPPPGATYGPVFDPRAIHDSHPREMWPSRRRYTVRRWDPERREVTLDFVVHGTSGVAGPWAAAAQPGDILVFNGPGSDYRPDPTVDWHLFVGDESALPAIAASLEALDPGMTALVRLVTDGPEYQIDLESPADLDVVWRYRTPQDPRPLIDVVQSLTLPPGRGSAFVHGEADEIRAVRRSLIGEHAMSEADLSCSAYWRRGMTDEEWRSVKKEFVTAMAADLH